MNEREFLQTLKARAREQEHSLRSVPFPRVFSFTITWLSYHPWRFLIPLAFLISLLLRALFGQAYTDGILWLFSL
jgi:hypothetical protein